MKINNLVLGVIIVFLLGLLFLIVRHNPKNTEVQKPQELEITKSNISMEPTQSISFDKKKKYSAVLHTDKGDITIVFFADKTPITVSNFITLAKKGFYNNTVFHRVVKDFMIQGGDPKGDGTGGPGYRFDDEPFEGEYTRGTVAMANAGPDTNGSQFFIMHKDYDLPKNYVIFGRVESGLEVVDIIAESAVKMSVGGEMSEPVAPVKITTIDIIEK